MKNKILIKRGYLIENGSGQASPLLAAKLLNEFGVEVDKPQLLSETNLNTVAEFFGTKIPTSFYQNPQDLKYYTCDELVLEQLVSYFTIGLLGVDSNDSEVFDRIELFKKALPNYRDGDEVVIRTYKIINKIEAENILKQIANDYCKFTRPWSHDELTEFKWLYMNGFYEKQYINCKDNAISLFLEYKDVVFAKMLDKKDVVKLSVSLRGENKEFNYSDDEKTLLEIAVKNAYNCPLSKKQAKYFNTIVKKVGITNQKETNEKSPYRLAKEKLKNGDVIGAAKVFANNGSLLERNLVWLLSRASISELNDIVDLIKTDNPIVLYQLLQGIISDDYKSSRTFKFIKNKLLKNHTETDDEFKYRKSKLSLGIKEALNKIIINKIKESYSAMPKLGKIYISEEFKNIALPMNTSSCGSGLDVLPCGSRLKIEDDYIRTFCYWKGIYDIDASAVMLKDLDSEERHVLNFRNYALKEFGDSALSSGDDRSNEGAEYQDFKISELLERGYKYVIYTLNGFQSSLDKGDIYCGYQNKKDLDTKVWSSKNIAIKINVKGSSREYMGFAIDLENKEMIILNQVLDSNNSVINSQDINSIKNYLLSSYLTTFNMYDILSLRGEVTNNPEDAELIFDRSYIGTDNQKVIKPFQVESLVALLKN